MYKLFVIKIMIFNKIFLQFVKLRKRTTRRYDSADILMKPVELFVPTFQSAFQSKDPYICIKCFMLNLMLLKVMLLLSLM